MEAQPDNNPIIDAYLAGELDAAARAAVEQAMRTDEKLRAEVEWRQRLVAQLRLQQAHRKHDELARLGHRYLADTRRDAGFLTRKTWLYSGLAASLLVAAAYWWLRPESASPVAQSPVLLKIPFARGGTLGFAGDSLPPDSVLVQWVRGGAYRNHYRFADTLMVFGPANPRRWRLRYDAARQMYVLQTEGAEYALEKGFRQIRPLREADRVKK